MICRDCIGKAINKLQKNDIIVLEYLHNNGAINNQCSFSKQTIQEEASLSIHHITGTLQRLELFDFISLARGSKSGKYYITASGIIALELFNNSISGVVIQ